ncbi:MAG TPA: ABC transporter substrate-binding protein [Chloroflexota bacterium]|nr:ABC transporter substrate-binding protein [Chloroflexota bacterium]
MSQDERGRLNRRAFLKASLALAGLGLLAPAVAACQNQPSPPTGPGAPQPPGAGQAATSVSATTPKIGGTLTFAQNQPIKSIDSINPQTYPAGYEGVFAIYDGLVAFDPKLKVVPSLAESWERSADNLTWTFRLRKGVKFHDGTPFNAQAVEAHIKRIQDPKNGSPNKNLWDHIKGIKVVDDSTIQLSTEKPFGPMLTYLAHGSGGIPSPDAVAKLAAQFPSAPIGTGPYKLGTFNAGTDLTLVRNDEYWGTKPKLDKIVMRSVPEVSSRVLMLDTGEADMANDVPPEEAGRLEKGKDTVLLRQSGLRTFWMEMNLNLDIFKDVRVRQALNYAVDKEAIVKNLFLGYAKVLDSPAASTIQGYKKAGDYAFDPSKAKQMLAQAGWTPGPNGVLQKDGVPLKFTLNTAEGEYPKDIQVVEAVQANLKAVGCDVSIWKVEAAARWSYLRVPISEAKGEMISFGFNPSNGDLGYHLNSVFHSNPDRTKAPYVWNLMWYANPDVDKLLEQANEAVDETSRYDLLGQAQKLIWDDAPVIWLHAPDLLTGARKSVKDVYIWPTVFNVVRDGWKES